MTSMAPPGRTVTLPPGWLRIPVEGSGAVMAALLDETFGDCRGSATARTDPNSSGS